MDLESVVEFIVLKVKSKLNTNSIDYCGVINKITFGQLKLAVNFY